MINTIMTIAALAVAATQVTRLFKGVLNSFNLSFSRVGNQILSWLVAILLTFIASWMGVVDATTFGTILYGILVGLASNGVWNIRDWFYNNV